MYRYIRKRYYIDVLNTWCAGWATQTHKLDWEGGKRMETVKLSCL